MTKIIEYREIKKKKLIFEFRFDRNENYISKHGDNVCTLDKYMSLNDWLDVYNRLRRRIDKYVLSPEHPPEIENVLLRTAQLELYVSFKETSQHLLAVIGLTDNEATYPYAMCVHVKAVSKVADYIGLQAAAKQSYASPSKASTSCNANIAKNEAVNADADEEYVPGGLANITTLLTAYIPTATTSQSSVIDQNLEYIPQSVNAEYDPSAYRPSGKGKSQKYDMLSIEEDSQSSATSSKSTLSRKLSQQSPLKQASISNSDRDDLLRTPQSKRSKPNNIAYLPAKTNGTQYLFCDSLAENYECVSSLLEKGSASNSKYKSGSNRDSSRLLRRRSKSEMNFAGSSDNTNQSQDMFGDDDDLPPHCTEADKKLLERQKVADKKRDRHYSTPVNTENHGFVTKRPHLDRKAKLVEKGYDKGRPSLAGTSTPKLKPPSLVEWLSKQKSKESATKDKMNNNDKPERKKKIKQKRGNDEEIHDLIAKENEKHQKVMDGYKILQNKLDEINTPVSVDRIIDLKDMDVADIIETFVEHKDFLQRKYDAHFAQNSRKVKHADDYDHLTMHSMMIKKEAVHKMIDKLREEFIDGLDPAEMQCHQLFWELLIPEWILAIFMDRFSMNRVEAVKHIRDQDEVFIQATNSFEIP